MFKKVLQFSGLLAGLGVLFLPALALAQPPTADSDIGSLVSLLVDSVKGGQWSMIAAAVIMVLVWVGTKTPFVSSIVKGEARVWIALGLGIMGGVVTNYFVSGSWTSAILAGLTTGAAASGLWSALGKRLLGTSDAPDAPQG